MQNLIQRKQVRFEQRTTNYERQHFIKLSRNVNQLASNEIYSTIKSYKRLTSTGTQQTFINGDGGQLYIGQNVQNNVQVRNFWGKESSVKMYSTKNFYDFATFNHVVQEKKDKIKVVESMKMISQINPEIRYQRKPGSVIYRQTVQSYPLAGAQASSNLKQRILTSTCVEGRLSRPIQYSTQYQSGLKIKGNQNEWMQQEVQRPNYFKFYNNTSQLYRNLGPQQDPVMKKTICVPACWVLWGLIGLIGALFGILFGLGLISGLGLKGFDFAVPQRPVVPIIPSIPQKPTNITVPQIPTVPVVPVIPIIPKTPTTETNKTQTTGQIFPVVVPPIFQGQNFIEPERIDPIRIQTTTVVPVVTPEVTIQPSMIPQINDIEPSITSPFISPSGMPQIIPFIEPSTAQQIFYPVPVPEIFITYTTSQIIYPQILPEIIQPQKIQQTSTFISPQKIAPQRIQTVNPVLKSSQPTQQAINVSTAPSTIFIKEYNEAIPVTTQVSSNISDNKYIFANSLKQNKETPIEVPTSTK